MTMSAVTEVLSLVVGLGMIFLLWVLFISSGRAESKAPRRNLHPDKSIDEIGFSLAEKYGGVRHGKAFALRSPYRRMASIGFCSNSALGRPKLL